MSERYVVGQSSSPASGVWHIYDVGGAARTSVAWFGPYYPGGPEAAARAEAARLNALPVQPAYRVERHPHLIDTWMVVRTASETLVARFYPDAPGGARAAAEEQVRRWNGEKGDAR